LRYTVGVMPDDAPKTAYELAMERLRSKEKAAGAEERPLTDKDRAAIAEVRKIHEAKLAEREILHQHALRQAKSHEEVAKLAEELLATASAWPRSATARWPRSDKAPRRSPRPTRPTETPA
jgi:hypothetical protein